MGKVGNVNRSCGGSGVVAANVCVIIGPIVGRLYLFNSSLNIVGNGAIVSKCNDGVGGRRVT